MIYTKKILKAAAKDSFTISEVLRKLGKRWSGGLHSHIKRKLKELNVDTSHFTGKAMILTHTGGSPKRPPNDILKRRKRGRREATHRLRRALVESGVLLVCAAGCKTETTWNGKPLVLEINHKNGNNLDDRKVNLEFLCPNCHSQIPNRGSVTQR